MIRVDFALIPDEPLFTASINASQAITDEYDYNKNLVDAKTFPPHVTLLICVFSNELLSQVIADLKKLSASLPALKPRGIGPSSGGYVMLNIERTPEIVALQEAVLDIAANARECTSGDKCGSQYLRKSYDPHISLAKIDRQDQDSATKIGQQAAGILQTSPARALELCDIGERSDRWEVLATFPV